MITAHVPDHVDSAMCHAFNAEPPIAPVADAAVDARDITLVSADGTRFAAYWRARSRTSGRGSS